MYIALPSPPPWSSGNYSINKNENVGKYVRITDRYEPKVSKTQFLTPSTLEQL